MVQENGATIVLILSLWRIQIDVAIKSEFVIYFDTAIARSRLKALLARSAGKLQERVVYCEPNKGAPEVAAFFCFTRAVRVSFYMCWQGVLGHGAGRRKACYTKAYYRH